MGNPRTAAGPQAPVRDVMAQVTISVSAADTLTSVAEHLAENDIGALPVMVGAQLRGIVTERDLIRAMAEGADPDEERAGEWMTTDVESVGPDTPIEVATGAMVDGGVRHLPVLDGERLVGMLSVRDLLTAHASFPEA
jgi:CBS domain-containing protein